MINKKSIRLGAGVLLTTFSLNILIGFTCSLGLDMGFNSKDKDQAEDKHHEGTEAVVHIHKDGKKHIHYEKKGDHKKIHSHGQEKQKHSDQGKENCCTDHVQKLEQSDKSLPEVLKVPYPGFILTYLDVFYKVGLPTTMIVKNIKQFVRSYHPPIQDIRIAVQSFQI